MTLASAYVLCHLSATWSQLQMMGVKNKRSGLSIFLFSFLIFILFLIYFPYSIFRTRVRVRVARSHCHTAGHIR